MTDDDLLWVEEIDHKNREPVIGVYREPNGVFSFSSSLGPRETAAIFAGLASNILEYHLNG